VLVARSVRDWSTHIVIGTTGLTIVRIVLLLGHTGVRVAGIHVFVGWGIDEAGWVVGFVDSGWRWWIVCGVVGWVWSVMVYRR
jgi:hypothetical protein